LEKSPTIKDVCSQMGEGVSSAEIFPTRERGGLQMLASTLTGTRNFGVFKIYVVSARTMGG